MTFNIPLWNGSLQICSDANHSPQGTTSHPPLPLVNGKTRLNRALRQNQITMMLEMWRQVILRPSRIGDPNLPEQLFVMWPPQGLYPRCWNNFLAAERVLFLYHQDDWMGGWFFSAAAYRSFDGCCYIFVVPHGWAKLHNFQLLLWWSLAKQ